MRGRNVLRVTAMAVAMLFLAGAAFAAAKTVRLSHITAKDSPWDKGANRFAELVAKAGKAGTGAKRGKKAAPKKKKKK